METPRLWSKSLAGIVFFAAALLGCTTAPVVLRPVQNQIPPAPAGIYSVKAVDTPPKPFFQDFLPYPPELKRQDIGGNAVMVFTVKADGTVRDIIVASATDVRFGAAAKESLQGWRFTPAMLAGRPVPCRISLPIEFKSQEEKNSAPRSYAKELGIQPTPWGELPLFDTMTPTLQTPPLYPYSLRSAGIGGVVVLYALVAPSGLVEDVKVLQSSGHPELDESTRACLRKWQYPRLDPALPQTKVVTTQIIVLSVG